MDDILDRTFDFGIRVVELANWLDSENRKFTLAGRLLECGTGVCVLMRLSSSLPQASGENNIQALHMATEAEFLLELMVKTGVLTEKQSTPMLMDLRGIREEIKRRISNPSGSRKAELKTK